jgi:hypothetical protein
MGKNFSGKQSPHVIAFLCLCLGSLVAHLLAANDGHFSIWDEARYMAEHGGIPNYSESHAYEDDFISLAPISANAASTPMLKTAAAHFSASYFAIAPLLPPPKTT